MNIVLLKVIVAQFYKMNTGFFLVLFILLFGLLDGKSTIELHYGIMQGITSSYTYALWAAVIWILYSVKCLTFGLKEINNQSNSFLFAIQSVADSNQVFSLLLCQTMLLLPVLVYGGVAVVIGVIHGQYLLAGMFAIFQILLCFSGATLYFRRLNRTWLKPTFAMPRMLSNSRKHFPFYLLHFSLHSRKATFVGLKVLSLLLLQIMLAANAYEINKESICVLMMFVISAHSLLPVYYVQFMEGPLKFIRNMPLSATRIYVVYVLTYSIVFLPELLFLLINGFHVLPLQLIFSLYATGVGLLLCYTSIQYLKKMNTDKYTGLVFVLFFGSLLFLASFNLWLMAVIVFPFSMLFFTKQLFKYNSSYNWISILCVFYMIY